MGMRSRGMRLRTPTVLLVDDEASIHFTVGLFLREAGYFVDTAIDGRDGLRKFHAGSWDLVITDLAMPGMGGEEFAQEIRKISPEVPVILITGCLTPDTHLNLFNDVLEKPFSERSLLATVERVLAATHDTKPSRVADASMKGFGSSYSDREQSGCRLH